MGVMKTHLGPALGDLESCYLALRIMRVRRARDGPRLVARKSTMQKAIEFTNGRSSTARNARDGCVISYGMVTKKTQGASCLGPGATSVNQLHCTMHCTWSPGRVIWPVWWLVTTLMAVNSALACVPRLIAWRGTAEINNKTTMVDLGLSVYGRSPRGETKLARYRSTLVRYPASSLVLMLTFVLLVSTTSSKGMVMYGSEYVSFLLA
eukprot:SAG11_NODE_3812_length_2211_cov_4.823864_1_plen_208_part_00